MNGNNTFGERVRDRRNDLDLSQEELALKVGYKGRSTISLIEAGIRNPKQSIIAKLAEALDVPPSYLMGWSDINGNIEEEVVDEIEEGLKRASTDRLYHYLSIITETLKNRK